MTTSPNLKNDPELIGIRTKDDEIKDFKKKLKSMIMKTHSSHSKLMANNLKEIKNLNKKKVLLIIIEILVGSASTISISTMGLIDPGAGKFIPSSTALLTSIAILITNEYISKLIIPYTNLRDWIMVDKKIDEK